METTERERERKLDERTSSKHINTLDIYDVMDIMHITDKQIQLNRSGPGGRGQRRLNGAHVHVLSFNCTYQQEVNIGERLHELPSNFSGTDISDALALTVDRGSNGSLSGKRHVLLVLFFARFAMGHRHGDRARLPRQREGGGLTPGEGGTTRHQQSTKQNAERTPTERRVLARAKRKR